MEVGQAWHGFYHRIAIVIVDRLMKVAHFIPVKTTYTSAKLANIYMTRIVCLHGVPRTMYQIEEPSLPQSSGISYMRLWVLG